MRTFRILFFKEFKSYFLSPYGWLIIFFPAFIQAFLLSSTLKLYQVEPQAESLVATTFSSPIFWFYFLFIFPVLTMRIFSEENRSGTLEGLLTAPVRSWQVVLSKYFAALFTYVLLWIPAFVHFKLFTTITDIPPPFHQGELYGAFIIIFLIGMFFTAIGCLTSALTSSQIIAGIACMAILLFLFFLGIVNNYLTNQVQGSPFFDFISVQNHMRDFSRGLLDSRAFIYYFSMTTFVLFLTYHLLDFRRWKP